MCMSLRGSWLLVITALVLLVSTVACQSGACCAPNAACHQVAGSRLCKGTFMEGTECTTGLCVYDVTPYIDPLPIPAVIEPERDTNGMAHYFLNVTQVEVQLHSQMPATTVWAYNGQFPGPTFSVQADEAVMVTVSNDLKNAEGTWMRHHYFPVPNCTHGADFWSSSPRVVTHLHGAHAEAAMDGQPDFTLLPGEHASYIYSNKQLATTLWYHDHALGITRLNVYMGLAGAYVIHDAVEQSLSLPRGEFDVPLIMQDRSFNSDGSLAYPSVWQSDFNGNMLLVNGVVWPYMNVCQGKYRFRLVNGGNGMVFELSLDKGAEFVQIGTDGGLIDSPRNLGSAITLGGAERMDVVIDFESYAPGEEITMSQLSSHTSNHMLRFIVDDCAGWTGSLPEVLLPYERISEDESTCTNEVILQSYPSDNQCGSSVWLMDGLGWDDVTVYIPVGETQIFMFVNPAYFSHPMHVHLTQFQVLGRQQIQGTATNYTAAGPWKEPQPAEVGWKDVVVVGGYERVKVIGRFADYTGRFPYHCHITSHEDNEMMRQFRVTMTECNGNGVCELGEDCFSCPEDCASMGGQRCGNNLCEAGSGENCINCPSDCAGLQDGSADSFCCGGNNNPGENPLDCTSPHCLNADLGRFCKSKPNILACCGDSTCEGQETTANCPVDCPNDSPMYHPTVG